MNIFEKIAYYFQFPFVRFAMIVSILISLCASLIGITLVLRRFSFIGDGLSHVAFGAMAVAMVFNVSNNLLITLPITTLCAILILCSGRNAKIKGDATIAIISVSALAVGYLLMNVFGSSPNISGDVCSSLFGSTSILTLSSTEVWLSVGLCLLVVGIYVLFYHKIFAITFDESFARATGTKTKAYNLMLAVVISVVIVLAMRLVGSLLISALIIFPALSSMRIFKSYLAVTISSATISVLCSSIGVLIALLAATPVGATIVVVNLICFEIFSLVGFLLGAKKA